MALHRESLGCWLNVTYDVKGWRPHPASEQSGGPLRSMHLHEMHAHPSSACQLPGQPCLAALIQAAAVVRVGAREAGPTQSKHDHCTLARASAEL